MKNSVYDVMIEKILMYVLFFKVYKYIGFKI